MTWAFLVDSVPFTRAVIAGQTSLGGSESACLGLARALRARGHQVHVFTTQLSEDGYGVDHAGLMWHSLAEFHTLNAFIEYDVVVSLRMFTAFAWRPVQARLRILWNQDLLVPGPMQASVMGTAWAFDALAYVSDYHRAQWETLQPELKPLGWVTRNGFNPEDLPKGPIVKDPHRIIHISRPERGLGPILRMWPALKAKAPHATLQLCRYNSMYDDRGWGEVCRGYDQQVKAMNAEVGGITYLGELNKPQLYKAVAEAAVMWYPGVATFAETNCIAALEAAACGTPFVGSYRGALPETSPTGTLIHGDAEQDETYQAESIAAVIGLLEDCDRQTFTYRQRVTEGKRLAQPWTYDRLAKDWEDFVSGQFEARYQANKLGVLRQLLHEDDHVAAKLVADELGDQKTSDFCAYVMAGKDQSPDEYAKGAIADPLEEIERSDRFRAIVPMFSGCQRVLDVACGNGSFAIALTKAHPELQIWSYDYAAENIIRAKAAAETAGVADRCHFFVAPIWDFDTQDFHDEWKHEWLEDIKFGPRRFDGLFVGEFVEHVVNCSRLVDGLEPLLSDGATVVYSCPHGPFVEIVPRNAVIHRGHVHHFHHDDVAAVWGKKRDFQADYLAAGVTDRGTPIGNWIIRYTVSSDRPKAGERPLQSRIQRTRPLQTVSVMILAKNAETDIGRCLASVYRLADEILVGDTGSTDETPRIAASYGAKVYKLEPLDQQPEGFASARNALLAKARGDWALWIDCDEQIVEPTFLRRYLDGVVFNGFVIPQTHLYLDGPPSFDIPVRLFRHTGRVQFYGCIHEQPQQDDANGDIFPTLQIADIKIAHTGYLTQEIRETKRVDRNVALLLKDAHVFPQRLLGKVLLIREAVIQADQHRAHGATERARQGYLHAIHLFLRYFDDPRHKYHALARPWYEAALEHTGLGWQHEIGLAGRFGGLGETHAKPERFWVRDGNELAHLVAWKTEAVVESMAAKGRQFVTNPDDLLTPATVEVPA